MKRSRRLVSLLGVAAMVASVFVAGGSPAGATLPGDTGGIFGGEYSSLPEGETGSLRWTSPTEFGGAASECALPQSTLAVSPDGNQLAYACISGGDEEIFLLDLETFEALQLTENDVDDRDPAFSPNGDLLAISTVSENRRRICLLDLTTLDHTQTCLTDAGGVFDDWAPAFNPTRNDQVAFVSGRMGNPDIWVMAIGDEEPTQISTATSDEFGPNWSADGAFLAYSSDDNANGLQQIVVQNMSTNEIEILTESIDANNFEPAWSPDGEFIAFTTQGTLIGSESRLMVMTSEGSAPTELPNQSEGFSYDHAEWQAFGSGTTCPPDCEPVLDHRDISLKIRHFNASGHVTDEFEDTRCLDGVEVKVQRKKGKKWKTVSTDTTGPEGKFKAGLPEKLGKYRAKIAKVTVDPDVPVTCGAATSDIVKINKA